MTTMESPIDRGLKALRDYDPMLEDVLALVSKTFATQESRALDLMRRVSASGEQQTQLSKDLACTKSELQRVTTELTKLT